MMPRELLDGLVKTVSAADLDAATATEKLSNLARSDEGVETLLLIASHSLVLLIAMAQDLEDLQAEYDNVLGIVENALSELDIEPDDPYSGSRGEWVTPVDHEPEAEMRP